MADLIAQGVDSGNRWRRPLPIDQTVVVGRAGSWAVPWDDRVSRSHFECRWNGNVLELQKLPTALNPIFVRGKEVSEAQLAPGDYFVVGGTSFTLAAERAFVTIALPQPDEQQTFSAHYLRRMRFRHADQRIEILSRLPDAMAAAAGDFEQRVRIVNLLLSGVPTAEEAAIVRLDTDSDVVEVLHWDRRLVTGEDFQPSERLIRETIRRNESIVHVWKSGDGGSETFTARRGVDWAYCTAIPGSSSSGWALYVAGRFLADPSETSDPTDLKDDLKFTELIASNFGLLRDQLRLEHERASLSQFFSPIVLEALSAQDPDVALRPREAEVSVLFCDLRGFSRTTEKSAADLLGLLERVSVALGIATRQICDQSGVLGDFHGDAVMGFWGWPFAQPDAALRAARAALAIRTEFAAASRRHQDPLADFRVGIGIATGKAVAGRIGTVDQVKVTAFGPVVNLASRLQDMTKTLHAAVLLDETTAQILKSQMPPDVGRLRRVARVRPYGLEQPLEASELLPAEHDCAWLSTAAIAEYEQALDDLYEGRWQSAFERLHRVPAEDRVKDFLTMFIVQHNRTAPEGWKGVIPLSSK